MNRVDNGNQWLMVTKTKSEVNRSHGAPEHGQRPLSPAEHVGEYPASLLLVLECHCQLSVCQLSACQLSTVSLSSVNCQFSACQLIVEWLQVPPGSSHPSSLLATERATCLRELQGATSTSREAREIKRTNLVGQASFLKKRSSFLICFGFFIKCSGSANVPATIGATKTSN